MPPLLASALVTALLVLLSGAIDRGAEGWPLTDVAGRVYFALLLGAPLLVYPFAWRAGWALPARLAVSLGPGFLWWLTEVRFRLGGHELPEALWLAASPLNFAHLYFSLVALLVADLGCRLLTAPAPGERRVRARPLIVSAAAVVLGPFLVVASVQPFLHGYRALFQADLLPMPESRPGPLAEAPPRLAPGAPNVVFILSDDHRFDAMGHAGHPFVETPSLDRLAAEGVRFTRAYVTSSLCSPSRASFLTGTYPHRHGVWNNFTPWSAENQTFLEHLGAAGYATAFIGKWHMPGGLPELRGVDHFVTFTAVGGQGVYEWCPLVVDGREEPSHTRYIATELTNRALAWLDLQEAGRPFALVLSHKNVHAGFLPDEPERSRYADAPLALPPGAHTWSGMTLAQYVHLNAQPLEASVRRYAEAVVSLDREIGRLLDSLAERGLEEGTVVVYASDNGYLWGEHGLVDKRWAFEESIRVPFLVRYPASGHRPGESRDALVANVDLAPTLLELAGLPVPDWMQGASLAPLLRDPAASVRDAFFYAYYEEPPYPVPSVRALVTPQYKYAEYDREPPQLFDLEADPRERENLAAAKPQLASELAARLHALAAAVR